VSQSTDQPLKNGVNAGDPAFEPFRFGYGGILAFVAVSITAFSSNILKFYFLRTSPG